MCKVPIITPCWPNSICSRYHTMNISQNPIQSLLLIDNELFPLLLEYGQTNHSDYWLLFTLEADDLISQTMQHFSSLSYTNNSSLTTLSSHVHKLLSSLFSPDTVDGYCSGQAEVKLLSVDLLEKLRLLLR
jgi:hypothetical protein